MEKRILRLLIVDDSPDDTEVAVAAVRTGGYIIKSQRVQDLAGMQAALDKGQWDVALSEYALPHFGALMAYDLLKRAGLDIPFIVFTREIPDADLTKMMQAGARDVVLKSQTVRLAPVVARELAVAEMTRAYRAATVSLQEMESKHRAVIEGSREAICYSQDGMHVNANKVYLTMFGYNDAAELEGIPVMNLIEKADQPRFKEMLRKLTKDGTVEPQEFVGAKQDGTRFPVEFAVSTVMLDGEPCTQIMVTDISRRKAVESKLQYLNQHDPLTGLYNRHHFLQELGKAVERAKSGEGRSAILYMDVDQLKDVNDALGYAAGDRLLIRIAKLLREHLGEESILSRFGGDEFAALVFDRAESQLQELAGSIQSALKSNPFSEGGKTYHCQCSLNVTPIDRAVESAQHVLSRACRVSPKARPAPAPAAAPAPTAAAAAPVAAAEPSHKATAPNLAGWKERIQAALQKGGFTLAYQPIINLHGDPAEYFEVLVRMNGRDGELIHAGEFMAAAEQSGMSALVDRWVVRHAIESLASLHREGREASFFINLCATAFKDKELLQLIGQTLFSTGVRRDCVVFEADEVAITAAPAQAATFIKAIGQLGCHFAVDNFGKGPGALEHMRGLPVQFLKIDGALVQHLVSDAVNQATLRAVIAVAKALNLRTIAKSVEKAENLAMLWNFGLDYVQGHYFQEADTQLSYEYTGEATLASDAPQAPNWASR